MFFFWGLRHTKSTVRVGLCNSCGAFQCLTTSRANLTNFAVYTVTFPCCGDLSKKHRGNVSPLKDRHPSRAFSFFVCLPPFRQGGEVLFFLSVPCRCPAISAFYQKKKGKDFQDITAQKLPLTARSIPRRSIMAIWTRRHWRAGRAARKKRHSPPSASFAVSSPMGRQGDLYSRGQCQI